MSEWNWAVVMPLIEANRLVELHGRESPANRDGQLGRFWHAGNGLVLFTDAMLLHLRSLPDDFRIDDRDGMHVAVGNDRYPVQAVAAKSPRLAG